MKWNPLILAACLTFAWSSAHADDTTTEAPASNHGTSSSGWFDEKPASSPASKPADTASKPKKTPTRTSTANPDYAPAQDLLLSAMSLIGVRYKWGGNTPESGLDCSGFVRYVFTSSMNITLPRTAFEMAQRGQSIDKDELKPGDLVFFNTLGRTFSHVGIYLGDNRFIHSPRAGRSVEVVDMNQRYWQQRWNGARRISDAGGETVNISSLLASANSSPKRQTATTGNDASAAKPQQCRKVTTGKGSRKKTTTVCTSPTTASKPAKKTSKGKAASSKQSAKKTSKAKPGSTQSGKTGKSASKQK